MQKAVATKITVSDEAQMNAVLKECDAAIVRALKRIKKDQAAIDKLKKETRAMLAALKAA